MFHSSLLWPSYGSDPGLFPNRAIINVQPPVEKSVNHDEEDEWEIEQLVDRPTKRNCNGVTLFQKSS